MSTAEPKPRGRPFKPGASGNPSGRPPGVGKINELREAVTNVLPAILTKLARQALEGDVGAARLLLERTIPVVKAVELPALVPVAFGQGTLSDRGRQILEGVAAGTIPVGQAGELLAGLGTLARIVETDELAKRVEALEASGGKRARTDD